MVDDACSQSVILFQLIPYRRCAVYPWKRPTAILAPHRRGECSLDRPCASTDHVGLLKKMVGHVF